MHQDGVLVSIELLELGSGNDDLQPQLEIERVYKARVEMSSSRVLSNQIIQYASPNMRDQTKKAIDLTGVNDILCIK
jgi:hypothetical protein